MSIRSRNFRFIIYDDLFSSVLDKLNTLNCKFIYICHDRDYDENNELKKPHYHFILTFENARSLDHISVLIGLESHYIEPIKSLKSSVLYLVHFNNPDKTLYNVSDVKGDIELFNMYYNGSKSETADVQLILTFIDEYDCNISNRSLTKFCLSNNLWSTYRRNFSIITLYLKDHNNFY